MPTTRRLCFLALLLAGMRPSSVEAQDSIPARKPFVFGISAGVMSIDAGTAGTQLVGARSWGMQLDGGYVVKHLYLGFDLGPQFLSDKASFTQNTTQGTMNSTATLVYFSALAGPRTRPLQIVPGTAPIALGIYAGVSTTVSERSIDNCSDCYQEKMDIPGGAFVQPVMLFGAGRARWRVSDRLFLKGTGIRSVISAGMELGAQ